MFHLQSLKLPSSYYLSIFPQIYVSLLLLSPVPIHTDDLDGDLNDIKSEHHFWTLPLLNSHGDVGKGFRDFTPTFGLSARLANSTPLLMYSVPLSFTQDEVIVFVVKEWTLSASSVFLL